MICTIISYYRKSKPIKPQKTDKNNGVANFKFIDDDAELFMNESDLKAESKKNGDGMKI